MNKSIYHYTAVKTNPLKTGMQTTSRSRLSGPMVEDGFDRISAIDKIFVRAFNAIADDLKELGANPETIKCTIEVSQDKQS